MYTEHYKHKVKPPTEEETMRWQEIKFYIYMRRILARYELPQHAILFAHLFCVEDKYEKKLDALAQKIIGCDPTVIPSKKEMIIIMYKHNVPVNNIRTIVQVTQPYLYNVIDNYKEDEWYHPMFDDDTRELINIFNSNVEDFAKLTKIGGKS